MKYLKDFVASDDICGFITLDGDVIDLYVVDQKKLTARSDLIRETIAITFQKMPHTKKGAWLWLAKKRGKIVAVKLSYRKSKTNTQ